jgi:transcriptional regulator with XRE-family HTH domain
MAEGTTFFGQWLRQRRRSLDLTQTELADMVGCSVVTIRKVEVGERRPSRQMAILLANKLGIADEERPAFVRFARTDQEPELFRHPLFVTPANAVNTPEPDELAAPETLFPADFPGWIEVAVDESLSVLSNRLLIARYHSAPIDSPSSEILEDGRQLCKIASKGRIAGAITGTIHQEITQLHAANHRPDNVAYTAAVFTIETDTGFIKGSCDGFMTQNQSGTQQVRMHGKIFSVTDRYADLFLADVDYASEVVTVPYGVKDQGVLRITTR